jgi:hypothetical protein
MVTVELIKKTRVGRVLNVKTQNGSFEVVYNGYGIGYESVLVNGQVVSRKASLLKMVPRFEFPLGPHNAVVEIKTTLWRDLLGPVFGRLDCFSLQIDGQPVYQDAKTPNNS